jgi:hypothetical protein
VARCTAEFDAINANSTTVPIAGLIGVAGQDFIIREIGVFNDGTTAVPIRLEFLVTSANGTTAAITPYNLDFANHTVLATPKTWSAAPTVTTTKILAYMPVGAAVGAGTILTWYGDRNGLLLPAGTGNLVVLIQKTATSQAVSGYFVWDE